MPDAVAYDVDTVVILQAYKQSRIIVSDAAENKVLIVHINLHLGAVRVCQGIGVCSAYGYSVIVAGSIGMPGFVCGIVADLTLAKFVVYIFRHYEGELELTILNAGPALEDDVLLQLEFKVRVAILSECPIIDDLIKNGGINDAIEVAGQVTVVVLHLAFYGDLLQSPDGIHRRRVYRVAIN